MIVSHNWLREYVSLDMPLEELTHRLTMSGLNLEGVESIGEDTAIDLEVTSNRPDCLGHIGVAREISVLFDTPLSIPPAHAAEGNTPADSLTKVSIDCPALCHEYHARIVQGVKIGPSPAWLTNRLAAVGVNSVNNIVDVTNYVMLECGQPLHAFDFDRLNGGRIVVRQARRGEKLRAIDQRDYELSEEMCVIADASEPVAVAGVMGGLDTEISEQTVNVLIETASFDSLSVRSTARSLKLHSPSSFRFERRIDRRNIDWASRRCCELILEVAGGSLCSGSVVASPAPQEHCDPVSINYARVESLLGISIPSDECRTILTSLGLKEVDHSETCGTWEPPSWRPDLTRDVDLIEEIARIHGYEHIPDDATLPVVATHTTTREETGDRVRNRLIASGFSESLTLSFVSAEQQALFTPIEAAADVAVEHSSRRHENLLRSSLIPSLLGCRRQNERHGNTNAELFELARVYRMADPDATETDAEPLVVGMVSGRPFRELKGVLESLVEHVMGTAELTATPSTIPQFATGRGAELQLNGQEWGWIGELDRSVIDQTDLREGVTVAEVRVDLLESMARPVRTQSPISAFPSIARDLNFALPVSVTWRELEARVRASGGELLNAVFFAGQYRGKQIAEDRKSYLVTCRFGSSERTLTAEEVDSAVRDIVSTCETDLSATLR